MARTASPAPCRSPVRRTDERPKEIDFQGSIKHKHNYSIVEERYEFIPMNQEIMIMIPTCWEDGFDRTDDSLPHEGRQQYRCWKTCVAYEKINEYHPRLAQYAGRDPWTNLPLFKIPSGPSLEIFLNHHKCLFYKPTDGKPAEPVDLTAISYPRNHRPSEPKYLSLMYQWALQLLSAIEFVHSHDIILGHFDLCNCWLSDSLDLSIVGFTSATFDSGKHSCPFPPMIGGTYSFHPLHGTRNDPRPRASVTTDLVLFGNAIYELMTTLGPGLERPDEDSYELHERGEWPDLEAEYLGEVTSRCWKRQYHDAHEVRLDLVQILANRGFEVGEGDYLKGVDAIEIMGDSLKEEYR